MATINNYLVKALNTFHVRTLNSIGFNTRVTLNNSSNPSDLISEEFQIDLTIYDHEGNFLEYISDVENLRRNSSVVIDCKEWEGSERKDRLIIFHMIPLNLNVRNNYNHKVDLEKDIILKLARTSDNYVEYYLENGYSAGLLYQCFPFNYKKYNNFASTLIQAPKIFLNKEIDTLLSLFYSSPSNKLSVSKNLNCSILNPNGEVIFKWIENVKPYAPSLISIKKILKRKLPNFEGEKLHNFTFLAVASDALIVPFFLIYNEGYKTLALEHSLPPSYYSRNIKGNLRDQVISDLINSKLFEK